MGVLGEDNQAQRTLYRKRRVDDLMLSSSSTGTSFSTHGSPSSSFKKLPNGKYACLICPHNPILDTPLMLSTHNKGSRHTAAEYRFRERELSRRDEINKRIALSDGLNKLSSSSSSVPGLKDSGLQDKPLIQHTQKTILEVQLSEENKSKARNGRSCAYNSSSTIGTLESSESSTDLTSKFSDKCSSMTKESETMLRDWHAELHKRKELELKFTAAGWKRDCHGKWYRDENVEFDSDEEDPNICLS